MISPRFWVRFRASYDHFDDQDEDNDEDGEDDPVQTLFLASYLSFSRDKSSRFGPLFGAYIRVSRS